MTLLARADGVLGEVALRATEGGGVELVVNGAFVMDSGDGSTERRLADAALAALPGAGWHVVVGGLGLGFTAAAALADPRVDRVTVVEAEPAIVGWLRAGLVPGGAGLLADPRLQVTCGNVADVLPGLPPGSVDAVLLDVDNGPGFLVHPANARVYTAAFLGRVATRLRPGGVLAVWSADAAPALAGALRDAAGACREERLEVRRAGRVLDYRLYLAAVPAGSS